MPTYGYRCGSCGHEFEIVQRITAEPLTVCPKCHGKLTKIPYAAGIIFKGSGYYTTDYKGSGVSSDSASSNGSSKSSDEGSESKSETKADSSSESGSDSKSVSKSDSKSESKSESKAETKSGSRSDSTPKRKAS